MDYVLLHTHMHIYICILNIDIDSEELQQVPSTYFVGYLAQLNGSSAKAKHLPKFIELVGSDQLSYCEPQDLLQAALNWLIDV